MKKILFGILFLFGVLSASAQNYEESVYLKNGSIVSGVIIEQIPSKSLKIQTRDGNIFAYEMNDVDKITKERVNRSYNKSYSYSDSGYGPQVGYKGFFDFGYSFGVGDYRADRIEFSTSHGYQVNSYLYAGIGAGLNYFTDAKVFSVPIFANPRLTIPTNSLISPFLDIKIGYTVSKDVKGFYFAPSIGSRFDIGGNKAVNFSFGYTLQNVNYDYDNYYYNSNYDYYYGNYYDVYSYSGHKNFGALTLKLGFEF